MNVCGNSNSSGSGMGHAAHSQDPATTAAAVYTRQDPELPLLPPPPEPPHSLGWIQLSESHGLDLAQSRR